MTEWPKFITADLGQTAEDEAEMIRRWQDYDRQMKSIVAAGGVHQDADGWWVDDATGELIGPDPELERPRTGQELAGGVPFDQAFPELAESIRRSRGRPPKDDPKEAVTLRLPRSVLEEWKSRPDWRARMAEVLEKAAPHR